MNSLIPKRNLIIVGVVVVLVVIAWWMWHQPSEVAEIGRTTMPGVSTQTEAAIVPSDIVAYVPLFEGAEVYSVSDTTGADGRRSVPVVLLTDSSVDEVNAWYASQLAKNGWVIDSDKKVGGYRIIQADNDKTHVSVQAASSDGQTRISQQIIVRYE